MRTLTLLVALSAIPLARLAGQAQYSVTIGATGGTRLLSDRIVHDIRVTQAIAPTATLGASLPVSARLRAGLEIALGFGKTRIRESGIPSTDGPDFRTLGLTAGIEGPLRSRLSYRAGAGVLKYLPDKQGIFRSGGPLLLVLTGGADYHVPLGGPLNIVARLRYDYQRFSTDALRVAGFTHKQDVHRIGVGLGIEYPRL